MKPRRARRLLGDATIPKDLQDLFAVERARPEGVARAREDRVWERVGATIGAFPPGGGPGGGGHGGDGERGDHGHGDQGGGEPAADAAGAGPDLAAAGSLETSATSTGGLELGPAAVGVGEATGAATAGGVVGLGAKAWVASTTAKLVVAASIAVAAGTGIAVSRGRPTAAPAPVAADPAPPSRAVAGPEPRVDRDPRPAVRGDDAPVASASASPPRAASRDQDLAAERDLLEQARGALGRSDAAGAIALLSRHAAEHPRGRLGDEREALWVRALVVAGRRDEARARFEAFRARAPESLFVPVMEAAIGGS